MWVGRMWGVLWVFAAIGLGLCSGPDSPQRAVCAQSKPLDTHSLGGCCAVALHNSIQKLCVRMHAT